MVVFIDGMVTVSRADRQTMLRPVLAHRLDELLGRHVSAQVDHLEAAAFEHGRHQVLADVVQVALHRADGHASRRLGPARRPAAGGSAPASPSWRGPPAAAPARSTLRTRSAGPPRPWPAPCSCTEINWSGSTFSARASLVTATAVLASPFRTASYSFCQIRHESLLVSSDRHCAVELVHGVEHGHDVLPPASGPGRCGSC